ncbi:MAG: hypothetical protein ACXVIF_05940 [Halobacteriota archaeon]
MNLDDLKVIRSDERRSRRLTTLKGTFYADLKDYLEGLARSNDRQKMDEYENALRVAEAIYDKRVAKITKLAALAAKGHEEHAPLTDEEMRLFDMIFNAFTRYKEDMLAHETPDNTHSIFSQEHQADISVAKKHPFTDAQRNENEESVKEQQEEFRVSDSRTLEELSAAGKGIEELDNTRALIQENRNMRYVQVRVLADIPAFVGLDGETYKLSNGEAARLPEGNAKALTKRQVAIIIGDKVEDA